ncbi:MAG: hypothetical protein LBR75_07040 [Prevotellaceae bacterium]|jgi:cell division protein FtsQ|nr:hypothetical protein [Prevotellaceae bacterium]
MKQNLKIISITLFVVALLAYIAFSAIHYPKKNAEKLCTEMLVSVVDSAEIHFITRADIERFINSENLNPIGKRMDSIDLRKIEQKLQEIPFVKHSESYKTHSGAVRIDVWQRKPLFRVMSDSRQYYVYIKDEDEILEGETPFGTMPTAYKNGLSKAFYVPVVTGNINVDFLPDLAEFILFLQGNQFWGALIEQINVTPKREIELVSKIGSPVILLGKLDGYETKLEKLKKMYDQGLTKIDWEQYSRIDLKYDSLVYAVKKAEL